MGQWEWDLRTDSLFWCERTYELLGLEPFRTPRIKTFLDRVHPDDEEAVKRFLAEAVNERQDLEIECRVLRSWHEQRSDILWLAFRAMVLRDEQGQAVRMVGVLYDITPRKQMEEELHRLNNLLGGQVQAQIEEVKDRETRLEAEAVRRASVEDELQEQSRMLEAFFQHTITPLAFLDRQFNYVRINQAYAGAAGKGPEYFVGKNYFAFHPHDEDRPIFEEVVQAQQPYRADARPFAFGGDAHARTRYWNWRLTPLLDGRGQVQFLVLNLEDVTDRQKAFEELEQRARQLQKLTLELTEAEERERKHLAEILHDNLQQVLAAAKLHVGLLSSRVKKDAESHEIAEQAKGLLVDAIAKSRSLSHELSAPVLSRSNLCEAFEWLAEQMQQKHRFTVHLETGEQIEVASEPLRVLLYKAAQETVFNAPARRVHETRACGVTRLSPCPSRIKVGLRAHHPVTPCLAC
jgi:PAS domain S-box-containing protein